MYILKAQVTPDPMAKFKKATVICNPNQTTIPNSCSLICHRYKNWKSTQASAEPHSGSQKRSPQA